MAHGYICGRRSPIKQLLRVAAASGRAILDVLTTDHRRPRPGGQPRILLLSPAFPPATGGIERTAGELAGGLTDYSIEVVSGQPPRTVGMRAPDGVRVHWAANDPPYGRRATLALTRLAVRVGMRFRPDLVLALHTRTMPAARVLARLCGARSVLVVHAKEVPEQPGLARAALAWADAVVTVSDFSRSLALAAGADPDRVGIINPGVTLPCAAPPPLASRPGPPTIITVARMSEPHKGHDVALVAMQRLQSRLPAARWTMVGDGSLRGALIREARRRGLDGCVEFPGAVGDEELDGRLGGAHVFCLLSREPPAGAAGEGFGIAFVEAGAHGLPVVAGRIPGVVDAVRHERAGLLLDPRDPDAVADALERLLVDVQLAQRLADGGRQRAGELAWPTVVDRYRAVIERVLGAPSRASSSRQLGWVLDVATGPKPET